MSRPLALQRKPLLRWRWGFYQKELMTETYSGREEEPELEKDVWFANPNRDTKTTKDLLRLHEFLCEQGRLIMEKKNSDYGASSLGGDPFRNFQAFGAYGILVRLSDKMARLRTFIEKAHLGQELAVKDEKWEDTLIDAINYLVLLDGFIRTHGVGSK